MPEQTILQDGVDRVRDAMSSVEDEIQRVQKDLRSRRKDIEKQLSSSRKDFEKRARKLRAELRKNPTVKRLDRFRRDATKQLEEGVENLLGALQIASKGDVQRIDRKLSQLNRKLKEMERGRGKKSSNGAVTESAA